MIKQIKSALVPLDSATEEELLNAFDAVEAIKEIEDLNISRNPQKIKEHYETIQRVLKKEILLPQIKQALFPLTEIASGMKEVSDKHPDTVIRVSWSQIQDMTPDRLAVRLQGQVTKEMVLEKLQFAPGVSETMQTWFREWINRADKTKIEQFLFAMTGAPALGDAPFKIGGPEDYSKSPIEFTTCHNKLAIAEKAFETKDHFFTGLDTAIVVVHEMRGFDVR